MSQKQLNNEANQYYLGWVLQGSPEACDYLNNGNRSVILSYMKEFPNAMGYKFHKGIIQLNAEQLYNGCCDYVFNGTPENTKRIIAADIEFQQSKMPNALIKELCEADGIGLIWS